MFFNNVLTIVWRDWIVLRRRLRKFILARLMMPILYLIAFGWGLGKNIVLASESYLDFLIPGIIALNVMNVSYMSVTSVHAERIYHKSLEEYLCAPINSAAYVIGKIISAMIRVLISITLILGVAKFFGASLSFCSDTLRVFENFLVVALSSIIFSSLCFCIAIKVQTYEELAQFNTFFLMPMSFLCGTFFNVTDLPLLARYVIEVLPLTHAIILLRSGFNLSSVLVLVIYATIFISLSIRNFKKLQ